MDRALIQKIRSHFLDGDSRTNKSDAQLNLLLESPLWSAEYLKACRILAGHHIFSEPHCLVASSGSETGLKLFPKLIALSNAAVKESARAVNQFVNACSTDTWGLALPVYHVGGLGILVRAWESGSEVIDLRQERWTPKPFVESLARINWTSLVPTQIFDLVQENLRPPEKLQGLFVGGAYLEPELYFKARKLGWPLLPSFGMTELSSQIASANLDSLNQVGYPRLHLLPHIQARKDSSSYLEVKSKSLMTGYWDFENSQATFKLSSIGDWHKLSDLVEIENGYLRPLGRTSDFVKILGEGVNLFALEGRFRSLRSVLLPSLSLVAIPDPRRGAEIYLCYFNLADEQNLAEALEAWNKSAVSFEKIKGIIFVDQALKSEMGKVSKAKIVKLVIDEVAKKRSKVLN